MRTTLVAVVLVSGLVTLLSSMPDANAHPRMSATSGAPCSTCHYNSDGGGLRTEIGFDTQKHTGVVDYDSLGISIIDDRDTNRVVDWMATGVDARVQMARGVDAPGPSLGEDNRIGVELPSQHVFPMQFQPYVLIDPIDEISFYGSYPLNPDIADGELCSVTYAGSTCGQAYVSATASRSLPTVRAGVFRPSTGIRHDDHTMLTYLQDPASGLSTTQPPNYGELGVEAYYQPRHWLRVEAGGYRADQLSAAIDDELTGSPIVEPSDVGYLGRLTFFPRLDFGPDRSFYGWVGGSVYGAGDYRNDQGFVGIGWLDRGALMFEVSHLDFGSGVDRRTVNASTTATYEFRDWLVPQARVEQSRALGDDSSADRRRTAVAGMQFYPVPFVKLQPEYRYTHYHNPDGDGWSMGQYNVQLHLFY